MSAAAIKVENVSQLSNVVTDVINAGPLTPEQKQNAETIARIKAESLEAFKAGVAETLGNAVEICRKGGVRMAKKGILGRFKELKSLEDLHAFANSK